MRVALTLCYNGTHFLGSQIQKSSKNTVFGNLTQVLKQLGIDSKVIASGRTDRGVHATGQVCHFDIPEFWDDLEKLKRVLNEMLSPTIKIKKVQKVDDEFHARYSTKKRVYRYIIQQQSSNPFENDFITFLDDIELPIIQQNIKLFIGKHNFSFFMKTGSETKSPIRTIYKAFAYKHKGKIILNFEADGFLRSQIRLMVQAILKLNSQEIKEQLAHQKQHNKKPAPPNGLYLAKIKY